ncbi:MAG TPA: hypothetical protein VNQ79_11530 [Blastocatellia bacterium]|nr:hypothetical protein [Blastocatellia bacterium]
MFRTKQGFRPGVGLLVGLILLLSVPAAEPKSHSAGGSPVKVRLLRTPNGGIQPQAVMDARGVLHLIWFAGEPGAGDIFYARRAPGQQDFSTPLRVNSQPGSAVALGTIRGAQLAVGKNGRVHVAWNGSQKAEPRGPAGSAPMLYARLDDSGTAFEPQRNVMQFSGGLDGGGSVAADQAGNVYVVWHGKGEQEGEAHRRVWIARSTDEGRTFAREVAAFSQETGACGCCGMRAFADERGDLYLLYRTATEMVSRGMFLLVSRDRGRTFRGLSLDDWKLTTCPMSSVTVAAATGSKRPVAAWENNGQIFFAALDSAPGVKPLPVAAPGEGGRRKHPAVAVNERGEMLIVWTEGTGWKKGGSLAWQVFDQKTKPVGEMETAPGVPVWGLPTVVAEKDNSFLVIY